MKKEGENQRITSGHDSSGGRLKAKVRVSPNFHSLSGQNSLLVGCDWPGGKEKCSESLDETGPWKRSLPPHLGLWGKTLTNSAAV